MNVFESKTKRPWNRMNVIKRRRMREFEKAWFVVGKLNLSILWRVQWRANRRKVGQSTTYGLAQLVREDVVTLRLSYRSWIIPKPYPFDL